ncbi:MAG: hypothetical protein ACRET3_13005 [Burkholderiales bacterium]
MIDRNKPVRESGVSYPWAVAVLPQAAATPGVSTERTANHDASAVYFPAQYVNQATDIEPMPPTF